MKIETEHDIGESVYLKTDTDQRERIITQIRINPNQLLQYNLIYDSYESIHYEFEFTKEKDILKTVE